MYRILRKENAQLKEGRPVGSTNVEDYEFGLNDEEKLQHMSIMQTYFIL